MQKKQALLLTLTLALASMTGTPANSQSTVSQSTVSQSTVSQTADAQTRLIVAATQTFLKSLSAEQQKKVQFAFTPQKTATAAEFNGGMNGQTTFVGEKYGQAVWSNYPVSDVIRPGLSLGSLTATQRSAAMKMLSVVLSPSGYQKIIDIMDSDQVLSESGTPYDDGKDFYIVSVFGAPSLTSPWMLQFGGHHLGINVIVSGANVSLTPTLTGDQPATFTRNGKTVRPLGDENDKAFKLMNALSAAQQKKATLTYQINNLVLGPGQDGKTLQPEGIPVSEFTAAQQTLLLNLISEWVGLLNANDAAPKMAQIRANLKQTHFAWYGNTTNPSPIYFRITAPTLHIEFAHQEGRAGAGAQSGGINHIHSMYRDPTNAYGAAYRK